PCARSSQLRYRAHPDGPAILARRGGDGPCRHACRGVHYERRPVGLVHWCSAVVGLRGLRHHSLRVAAANAVNGIDTKLVVHKQQRNPLRLLTLLPRSSDKVTSTIVNNAE